MYELVRNSNIRKSKKRTDGWMGTGVMYLEVEKRVEKKCVSKMPKNSLCILPEKYILIKTWARNILCLSLLCSALLCSVLLFA